MSETAGNTRQLTLTITVDFEEDSPEDTAGDLAWDLENALDAIFSAGNHNDEGPFYDRIEGYSIKSETK